jgi:hypothetical protein
MPDCRFKIFAISRLSRVTNCLVNRVDSLWDTQLGLAVRILIEAGSLSGASRSSKPLARRESMLGRTSLNGLSF